MKIDSGKSEWVTLRKEEKGMKEEDREEKNSRKKLERMKNSEKKDEKNDS